MLELLISVIEKNTHSLERLLLSRMSKDVTRITNTASAQINRIDLRFVVEETTIGTAFQWAAEMKMKRG